MTKDLKEEVVAYDFSSPTSIPSEHLSTMVLVHEEYARGIMMLLSAFLRADVEVSLNKVEQMNYSHFVSSVVSPSYLATFDMRPLNGFGVIDISPSLIFLIVNRMAGGVLESSEQMRSFTELEMAIVRRLLKMLLKELTLSWEFLLRISFSLQETQTNPAFVRITSASEPCIVISLKIKIEDVFGLYTICLPYANLEPLADKLSAQQTDSFEHKQTESVIKANQKNFNALSLELTAVLGDIELAFTELLSLQEGDILDLGKRTREPILIRVGDVSKYLAKPGLVGRYKGVSIHKSIFNEKENNEE